MKTNWSSNFWDLIFMIFFLCFFNDLVMIFFMIFFYELLYDFLMFFMIFLMDFHQIRNSTKFIKFSLKNHKNHNFFCNFFISCMHFL